MKQTTLADWEFIRDSLGPLPEPLVKPVLILVSGLPGTGKSYFSHRLLERFPLAILETDALRRVLFSRPSYSAQESSRLFTACHRLIKELLSRSIAVLLDATNLVEVHRERLYHIADRVGAKLIIVRVEAPADQVRRRLENRSLALERGDQSEANWGVYERMRPSAEPIRRNHFAVDTSRDVAPVLDKIMREINRWLRVR